MKTGRQQQLEAIENELRALYKRVIALQVVNEVQRIEMTYYQLAAKGIGPNSMQSYRSASEDNVEKSHKIATAKPAEKAVVVPATIEDATQVTSPAATL